MKLSYISYKNNWAADEYYVSGKRVHILEEIEFDGVTYPVITSRVSVPYNDMGNTYTGVSNHFFINVEVLGIPLKIDLNTIIRKNTKIKATKFILA